MRTATTAAVSGVWVVLLAASTAAAPTRADLTGRWECDDGGTYFVRQVGDELWWTGRSNEPKGQKRGFANVFHGTISGNLITGSWADDPAGEARNAGKLTLRVVGEGKKVELKRVKEVGGFSGETWTPHHK